jgi:mRNA interferase RelE/StbE
VSNCYDVQLTRQAQKDIKAHRGHAARIDSALSELARNPELGHVLKGSLRGARSLEFNVKGAGAFRAIYLVFELERVCLVFIVGPHENIYARAERRAKELIRKSGIIDE